MSRYFWHQPPAPPGVAHEPVMWHCDEYRLRDAIDVEEVLRWARGRARPDQTFILHVEHRDTTHGNGLLRLVGEDPTAAPSNALICRDQRGDACAESSRAYGVTMFGVGLPELLIFAALVAALVALAVRLIGRRKGE